jgi:hypothetical protein
MGISFLSLLALGCALGACADASRPVEGPAGQTRTTSGTLSDPSYGNGNMNGSWSDPAASGYANHGSGQVGATTRSTRDARADGGPP